ncbi:MAG: hypothetical protein V1922_01965 [bacterium]
MTLKESNTGRSAEAGLLIAQREFNWKQPWNSIQYNKDLLRKEGLPLVLELGRAPLPTEFGDWTYFAFGDYTDGSHHELLIFGNIENGSLGDKQNVLARIHSACRTNEVYHAVNCECRKELHQAMKLISEEGRGVLIYLEQEGRGTGINGKMKQLNGMFGWAGGGLGILQNRDPETGERIDTDRAYRDADLPSETRDFDVAGEMLKHVGIKSVRLLTNNPAKIQGIESAGIQVEPVEIHISPDNEIIACDLRSKANNLGHHIAEKDLKLNGTG